MILAQLAVRLLLLVDFRLCKIMNILFYQKDNGKNPLPHHLCGVICIVVASMLLGG